MQTKKGKKNLIFRPRATSSFWACFDKMTVLIIFGLLGFCGLFLWSALTKPTAAVPSFASRWPLLGSLQSLIWGREMLLDIYQKVHMCPHLDTKHHRVHMILTNLLRSNSLTIGPMLSPVFLAPP